MPVVINGDTGITQAGEFNSDSTMGFKNRIINGAMVIDQRNAGASVTLSAAQTFPVDRLCGFEDTDGTMTAQRSTTAPAGFTNSVVFTTGTADASLGATQYAIAQYRIEGFNVADLNWGTANAATVTLSFWVRSSLTGTFGGALRNSAFDRGYPFTYTISAANTFEYKTITIPGDTTGTWLTDNGNGILVTLGLGVGSTYSGTAGSWAAGSYLSATGATSVIGTAGATWYITGLQLERGSTATSFDFRPYGTELALCQRYYYKTFPNATTRFLGFGMAFSGTTGGVITNFPVPMRTRPTALEQSGTASHYDVLNASGSTVANSAVPAFNAVTTEWTGWTTVSVASGLVAGNGTALLTANAAAYLAWSAEL